jgi:hypothetical protein
MGRWKTGFPGDTVMYQRISSISMAVTVLLLVHSWVSADVGRTRAEEIRRLSPEVVQKIVRYTVPLPKEIRIQGVFLAESADCHLLLPKSDHPIVEQIAKEFRDQFAEHFKTELKIIREVTPGFQAVLICGKGDPQGLLLSEEDLLSLRKLPVSRDGYLIRTVEHGAKPPNHFGVVLAGVEPAGLFYASKTFLQLIRGLVSSQEEKSALVLPVVEIFDWPDLQERGLWGAYALEELGWLGERKMNLVETHATRLTLGPDGRGVAELDPALVERARRQAIKLVPIITHLDQLRRTGIFEAYPHLLGKGDPKKWPSWVDGPVCWAEQDAQRVLSDWVLSLARTDYGDAVTVWLSEAAVQCGCDTCIKENQYIMETRAAVAAWNEAKKIKPSLELRILLTQGSYPVNDKILAEVPPDVRIIYYDGGRTYTSSHQPMIEPRLEDFVKRGGWLGVCPQLTASWRIVSPFSGAQFIHGRLAEFITKHLQCLYGYATPSIRYWDFNVEAAAEWSWNVHGRSTHEFAVSWAVRQNIAQPELVGQWSEILGPVSWDIYACGIPYPWFFGSLTQQVQSRRIIRPGEGRLAEIASPEQLLHDLEQAKKALEIAEQIGHPKLLAESEVILAYMQVLSALPELSLLLQKAKGVEKLAEADREKLKELQNQLAIARNTLKDALWRWARHCDPQVERRPPPRFLDTVEVCENTVKSLVETVAAILQPAN